MSSRLEAPMTMTFSRPSTPSISLSSCGTIVALDVGGHPRPAGAEDRVHLVEEHDDRRALAGLLPGPLEHQPDVPLGLADVLVEQLGALDVEEVGLRPGWCPRRPSPPRPSWPASWPPPWRSASSRSRAGRTAGCPSAAAARTRGTGRRAGTAARRRRGSARSAATGHRCRCSRCRGPLRGRAPRPRSSGSARRRSPTGSPAAASRRRAAAGRSASRRGRPPAPRRCAR